MQQKSGFKLNQIIFTTTVVDLWKYILFELKTPYSIYLQYIVNINIKNLILNYTEQNNVFTWSK